MGKRVAVAIFFGLIGAMTVGGTWSGFGLEGKDAVLAISFVSIVAVTFTVQRLLRGSDTP